MKTPMCQYLNGSRASWRARGPPRRNSFTFYEVGSRSSVQWPGWRSPATEVPRPVINMPPPALRVEKLCQRNGEQHCSHHPLVRLHLVDWRPGSAVSTSKASVVVLWQCTMDPRCSAGLGRPHVSHRLLLLSMYNMVGSSWVSQAMGTARKELLRPLLRAVPGFMPWSSGSPVRQRNEGGPLRATGCPG